MNAIKSIFNSVKQSKVSKSLMLLSMMFALPVMAHAAAISVPFISGIGCDIANWLKGPLAVIIFVLVVLVSLVVGMITKVKWETILSAVIVYGLIQGIVGYMINAQYINLSSCVIS